MYEIERKTNVNNIVCLNPGKYNLLFWIFWTETFFIDVFKDAFPFQLKSILG